MNGKGLEISLEQASWMAVDEARGMGESAMPVIERFSKDEKFDRRQIAVAAAGAVNTEGAAPILIAGLTDENVNVRLEAAKALQANPFPSAADAVAEMLDNSDEEVLREILALAAGGMGSEKMIEVLKKIEAADEAQVSVNAQMALAKIGDDQSKQAIIAQLDDPEARTRYNALEKLIYINDPRLAELAIRLLGDTAIASTIGSVRNPQYRRVCDRAVDTLVYLMKLSGSFRVSPEIIYGEREIREVMDRTR